MKKGECIAVFWENIADSNAHELLCEAYEMILGDEIGPIQECGLDEQSGARKDEGVDEQQPASNTRQHNP
jgi:hypothetical protein